MMKLGDKIKTQRHKLNLTQKDLSERTGLCLTFISLLENNYYHSIETKNLISLANALEITPGDLINPDDSESEHEKAV